MANQIEQLKISFEKMNITQKKQFIDKLKQKLQGTNNAEYTKLLNECVQKYNTELRVDSSVNNDFDDLLNDTDNSNVAQPAERLIAYLIDWVFMLPCYILIALGSHYAETASNLSYGLSRGWLTTESAIQRTVNEAQLYNRVAIILIIIGIVYSIFVLIINISYWKKGTSFGKSKMKLYVVNKETRDKISFGYMFLREVFGKAISGMVFSLGFIWILLDKNKQGWHDKLISSIVVKK